VDESQVDSVTVFAKLPRIGLDTPLGKYNPDFGYAVHRQGDAKALYLVVETKGSILRLLHHRLHLHLL
jgi:type III restriction enzyme